MQAIIYDISPFDSTIGTTIKFSWTGNQFFKNRCIIKNNETNEIVYDNTIETFKQEHQIDLTKATLINGQKYNAYITVFDRNDAESDLQSVGKPFLCLTTPLFQFSDVSNGSVISSSSYTFNLEYSQENGELLDTWSITVYTREHSLLSSSGIKYNTDNLTYEFSGFTNKNEYAIRALARTVNGMELDTGYINVSVTYDIRDIFSLIELTNMPKIGAVQVRSNIASADGTLENEPGIYIDDSALDLRENLLTYDKGFAFDGDFSFVILFSDLKPNKNFLQLYGINKDNWYAEVFFRIGRLGTEEIVGCFELRIISEGITSVHYSNKIILPEDTDQVGVCIVRHNGMYAIESKNLTKGGI